MSRFAIGVVNELRTRWNEIRMKLELSQSPVRHLGTVDFELVPLLRLRGRRQKKDRGNRDGGSEHALWTRAKGLCGAEPSDHI